MQMNLFYGVEKQQSALALAKQGDYRIPSAIRPSVCLQ